ncbi:hypothetical protein H920_11492 [Fukomys damarensis]|uniref:Uncharacterized protein n=1 Tax=Fukomys damarensis TaxID=885580 RepID=A0A091D7N4_FUKDA|nr:hypothetical protein H920_11492 [Fukomys damarensis]
MVKHFFGHHGNIVDGERCLLGSILSPDAVVIPSLGAAATCKVHLLPWATASLSTAGTVRAAFALSSLPSVFLGILLLDVTDPPTEGEDSVPAACTTRDTFLTVTLRILSPGACSADADELLLQKMKPSYDTSVSSGSQSVGTTAAAPTAPETLMEKLIPRP